MSRKAATGITRASAAAKTDRLKPISRCISYFGGRVDRVAVLGLAAMPSDRPPRSGRRPPGNSLDGGARPVRIPTLDQLAADPKLADELPRAVLLDLLRTVAHVQVELDDRLRRVEDSGSENQKHDRLLDVEQAAERLSTTVDWLSRNADKLPFTIRLSPGQRRFSELGIGRYIRDRQTRRRR